MIQKVFKHRFQVVVVFLSLVSFAIIRNYEDTLFYDPFLTFFKGEFLQNPLPNLTEWKLYLNLFFRFVINTILSLVIIHSVFKNRGFLKLAAFLYTLFFFILIVLFVVVLNLFPDQLITLFYIRRFIIQPLFLLLFIPGFYFQQHDLKKQNL
jgi:exosortase F-associated protein